MPHIEFHKLKRGLFGLANDCKTCRLLTSKKHYSTRTKEQKLYDGAKYRAKLKNIPFILALDDIKIPSVCPVTGKAFTLFGGDSPSLDQLRPAAGYTKENTRIISKRFNLLKNSATLNELRQLVTWLESQGCEL